MDSDPPTNVPAESATAPLTKVDSNPPLLSRCGSVLVVGACGVIFLALQPALSSKAGIAGLAKFGYLQNEAIWNGGYWGLITSALVHFSGVHLLMNLAWLWSLGSRLEVTIGTVRYLLFFVVAALVSSAWQLAMSGDTGIGASGVVYAIFGFMWLTRKRYPEFNQVLTPGTIRLMLIWFVGCIVASRMKVLDWNIGNTSHGVGLLFGCLCAGWVHRRARWVSFIGLICLLASAIVTLFWCPWSVSWLGYQAYRFHVAGNYAEALHYYNQVIDHDPTETWAYANRSRVFEALGDDQRSQADQQKLLELKVKKP